jgi:hypothetical protein
MIVPARRQAACAKDTRSVSSTQGGKERLVGKGTTIKYIDAHDVSEEGEIYIRMEQC